ncbi:calmodulin-binding protein 60 B-like isoform X3 [Alnus glutinosa]|uniref:calmodulin-binding protein 60 B-like isoform X3 n=1 Tax=Alnus glutinosa TaxID=3517 RepID=UPI002D7A1EF3|nr:calmodulin-binding protein 60 B-like isoform X3 [Alnus glutinosa]
MVEKKQFNGEDEDGFRSWKRRQSLLRRCSLKHLTTERDPRNEKFLENFFRGLVREEVERVVLVSLHGLHPSSRPALHQAGTSGVRSMQLQFVNKFPSTIFTGTSIKAEDGTPIQIELIDAGSRTRVNSGPLSSIKIELVVLKGDLCFADEEDWTEQEFNASISHERQGRRPLVTGDLTVTLRDGACDIRDINFTDNSSWMRTGKFRLGARVVQKHCAESIREARSDPFRVKDRRGEANQKHARPHLDDEIFRLRRIRRDGPHHKRLVAAGIITVKDFLRAYAINPSQVRRRLNKFSERSLETIIREAKTCYVDDGKLYSYYSAGDRVGLQFNSIHEVVAATFDGRNYRSVRELSLTPSVKGVVEVVKKKAYKHVNDWVPVNELSTVPRPPASLSSVHPFSVREIGSPVTHQDPPETLLHFNPPSIFDAPESSYQCEASVAQNSHPVMLGNSLLMEEFCTGFFNGDFPVFPSGYPATWEQGNDVFFASDVGFIPLPDVIIRTGKPKAAWCKIRAFVKWNSVLRDVAARRMFGYRRL